MKKILSGGIIVAHLAAADVNLSLDVQDSVLKFETSPQEIPHTIIVKDHAELKAQNVNKLDDAFLYASGILAKPFGPDNINDWLFIRGFEWQTYQNSLPKINENGYYVWRTEPFGFERIEALKGPASLFYGQNPPGGVVNVVSKTPTKIKETSLEISAGTEDYYHLGIDTQNKISNNLYFRVIGFERKNQSFIDGANSQRAYLAPSLLFDNSRTSLILRAEYLEDNTKQTSGFKLPLGTLNTQHGKTPYNKTLSEPDYNKNNTKQTSLGYLLSHTLNKNWQVKQNFEYSLMDLFLRATYVLSALDDKSAKRGLTFRDGQAKSFAIDNRVTGEFELSNKITNNVLFGLDYLKATSDGKDANIYSFGEPINIYAPVYGGFTDMAEEDKFDHKTNRTQLGLYARNSLNVDNFSITLGGRIDKVNVKDEIPTNTANPKASYKDNAITKNLALMYTENNSIKPYISYAESFQPIAARENSGKLYKPEQGKQREIGVKFITSSVPGFINISAYHLTKNNLLATDPNDPSIRVQRGKVQSTGIEIEQKAIFGKMSTNINFTYNKTREKTKDSENKNKFLPAHPKMLLSGLIDYNLINNLTLGAGARFTSSSFGDAENTKDMQVKQFMLFDAFVQYKIPQLNNLSLQANVKNLTNKEYIAACDYWCYYGDKRTVNLTANYTF